MATRSARSSPADAPARPPTSDRAKLRIVPQSRTSVSRPSGTSGCVAPTIAPRRRSVILQKPPDPTNPSGGAEASVRSEHLVDLEDVSAWMPVASGLAHLDISAERGPGGPAMRLDFDFRGGGGFAVARRPLVRAMPESYVLSFAVRGIAPANRLELKLADATGRNVWWRHWNEFAFSAEWQTVRVSSSEIELAIAAGPGGAGTVWIADLRIEDRTYAGRPRANASSSRPGHAPECALDGDPKTSWRSDHTGDAQVFDVDFGE